MENFTNIKQIFLKKKLAYLKKYMKYRKLLIF